MAMHEGISHLAGVLGTWRGRGHGSYPTIRDFDYVDGMRFIDLGKPFLRFEQSTERPDGARMHVEAGFLRVPQPETVELVVAIPTGQSGMGLGRVSVDGTTIVIETDATVHCTPTAKRVDRIVRRFTFDGDRLEYRMRMVAVGVGLTLHLASELERVAD